MLASGQVHAGVFGGNMIVLITRRGQRGGKQVLGDEEAVVLSEVAHAGGGTSIKEGGEVSARHSC